MGRVVVRLLGFFASDWGAPRAFVWAFDLTTMPALWGDDVDISSTRCCVPIVDFTGNAVGSYVPHTTKRVALLLSYQPCSSVSYPRNLD